MEPQQEFEWNEAQKIAISVDLVAVAKQQLHFLAAVDRNRYLYDGPALERAIYRYNACWLPLLAKHTESQIFDGPLIAPLDCEWVWHCHRLNPVRYKSDCEELYGQILDSSNVVSSIEGINATQTEEFWNEIYPYEPYNIDLMNVSSEDISERIAKLAKYTKYDLVSAVTRQAPFFYQVSRSHMKNDIFIEEAVARYKGFLHLIKRNKEKGIKRFCVPTYDVDLIWHSHQLRPVAYCKDLNEALGKVLEHDDTDSDRTKGKKLDSGFSGTTEQWEETFGSRYWKTGAMYRGNAPSPVTRNRYSSNTISKKVVSSDGRPQEIQLPERTIVEVQLEFVAVKNLPEGQKGSLFVLFSKSQPDAFFNAKRKLSILSESGVKQVASFQCEPTGELLFELVSQSSSNLSIRKSSKTLGSASYSMRDHLDPISKLSVEEWLELLPLSGNMSSKPISLRVAISFTPPAPAPYMLEMIQSRPFSKNSCFFTLPIRPQHAKSWTHFTDEAGSKVVSLQMRDLKKAKDTSISGKEVIGLMKPGETRTLAEFAGNEWSVMDNLWRFHLPNKCRDDGHLFELSGTRMVKVFPGRKLDYEPRHCEKYETDYLTAVEFSVEDPYGKAVALLDLRSRFVKAKEKWMVLPGIILAFIISNILRKDGYEGFIATSKDLKINAEAEKEIGVESNGNAASLDTGIQEKTELSSGGNGSRCKNAVMNVDCGGDTMKSGGCRAGGCSENTKENDECGDCGGCNGNILDSKCSVDEQVKENPNYVNEAAIVA
ncbi:hypothetical protein L6164_020485 [Bauhinia variegata]|uniref:Uncharacterized protein n=1 Tax=Bauhinia variegata TaxID=167791 RepID=A0ACB9N021_BAUVA|nr:hypothetical protein L6164_020485 [Bauhinia variegata]